MGSIFGPFKGRQRILCPFCFEYFLLKDTPFRCASPMTQCAPVPDPVYQKFWNDSRPVGKVLPAKGYASTVRCVDCNHESPKRLCPTCHSELPQTTGDYRNYVFAVIGAKEAGKSHYIAVLIEEIKKRIGPSMRILIEEMSDDTIVRYRRDFYDPLFKAGTTIEVTRGGLSNASVRRPLVYSLTFSGRRAFGGEGIKNAVVLVFFDTAGEDLNDEDVMSTVNKYIYRSDGVILLVDPLQLPAVRDRLPRDTVLPTINTETADILVRTTRLIQKGRKLNQTDQIPIPLAIAFSKFDAVMPLVDPQFQLRHSARHDGHFDLDDFNAINGEMISLLGEWGGQDIVHRVQTRFSQSGFFGLTALGCNPDGSKRVPRVLPRRIEDPFLWLLAQNKLIASVGAKR